MVIMPAFIDDRAKAQLEPILSGLVNPVKLVFFTQKNVCSPCLQQEELLRELSALSNKISLEVYDFVLDGDQAMNYKIDKIPATAVVGGRDFGLRFYGLTVGYEFNSLLTDVFMVSTERSSLDPRLEILVKSIPTSVHLQVLVTLTCPYCPGMVHVAHQMAFVNENIRADMVDLTQFPYLAQRYNVTGVPKTVINEVYSFFGALPAEAAYLEILKAVSPQKYQQIREEAVAQSVGGERKIKEDHEYEVAIVGGGPAAMSAAVYAARKGLDVALIGKKLGGQISYTASVNNYLGLPQVSGADLTEAFRAHMEKHQVVEEIGVNVIRVEKSNSAFELVTEDSRRFKAKSVIYCAGKAYRKLGVPGEERFIGKSIGFCATCDAPLYAGKRVAVVGGGNSAFTSVRDLVRFASEIHLVHRRAEFRADASLIGEVRQAGNVVFHVPFEVREFLGSDKLTGIRLESVDRTNRFDLLVDGVFLEIGLEPNSSPLKRLVELTDSGEVPINRDQSTAVKGLFAAGDVSDVEEKQISVAVGQGALAALSAYKYLFGNRLIESKRAVKEAWE